MKQTITLDSFDVDKIREALLLRRNAWLDTYSYLIGKGDDLDFDAVISECDGHEQAKRIYQDYDRIIGLLEPNAGIMRKLQQMREDKNNKRKEKENA